MNSAIRLIPNEAHTKLVLRTRKVLRIVPPSEGVFASDRDAACGGDATEIAAPVRSTGSLAREAGSPDSPRENINQINSPTKGKTS